MTLGRAAFCLMILMITAFFGLSVKEHREAITLWEAKVAIPSWSASQHAGRTWTTTGPAGHRVLT